MLFYCFTGHCESMSCLLACLLTSISILKRTNIRRDSPDAINSPADSDILRASASRALDLCKVAAINVSKLAKAYRKTFCLRQCSPFLCYYVFSAAIMLVFLCE